MEFTKEEYFKLDKPKNLIIDTQFTSINNHSFNSFNTRLNSIAIPGTITKLDCMTFSGCFGLTNVELNEGLKEIGYGCFSMCFNLRNIELPKSITKLDNNCFANCSKLTNIKLNEGLKEIPKYCFMECNNLSAIELPKSITKLDNNCFYGLKNIKIIVSNNCKMERKDDAIYLIY